MNTPPDIIIKDETNNEEVKTQEQTVSRRRFPAVPQLMILGGLLVTLLGSAGFSFYKNNSVQTNNTWIDVELENSKHPAASLTTTEIKSLDDIEIEAKAGFVFDVANNNILYQKNPDSTLPIASITKLMTALLTHEILDDKTTVTIPYTATQVDSASGLQNGEKISIKSLKDYAMLASSNDAAQSLANAGALAISEEASEAVFVEAMNIRAQELGFETFTFYNAHGLDIDTQKAGAYGSAREITFLMKYIYENYPEILTITEVDSTRIYNENGEFHNASNTNRILSQIPQLRGSKTGYTILAGGNLTVIFDAGLNRPIIITVLGSSFSGRFLDVLNLIEAIQVNLTKSLD